MFNELYLNRSICLRFLLEFWYYWCDRRCILHEVQQISTSVSTGKHLMKVSKFTFFVRLITNFYFVSQLYNAKYYIIYGKYSAYTADQ